MIDRNEARAYYVTTAIVAVLVGIASVWGIVNPRMYQPFAGETDTNNWKQSVRSGFPRERGKQRPGRARSPTPSLIFYFPCSISHSWFISIRRQLVVTFHHR